MKIEIGKSYWLAKFDVYDSFLMPIVIKKAKVRNGVKNYLVKKVTADKKSPAFTLSVMLKDVDKDNYVIGYHAAKIVESEDAAREFIKEKYNDVICDIRNMRDHI